MLRAPGLALLHSNVCNSQLRHNHRNLPLNCYISVASKTIEYSKLAVFSGSVPNRIKAKKFRPLIFQTAFENTFPIYRDFIHHQRQSIAVERWSASRKAPRHPAPTRPMATILSSTILINQISRVGSTAVNPQYHTTQYIIYQLQLIRNPKNVFNYLSYQLPTVWTTSLTSSHCFQLVTDLSKFSEMFQVAISRRFHHTFCFVLNEWDVASQK